MMNNYVIYGIGALLTSFINIATESLSLRKDGKEWSIYSTISVTTASAIWPLYWVAGYFYLIGLAVFGDLEKE